MRLLTRSAVKRLAVLAVLLVLAGTLCWFCMIRMPGKSFTGELPPLTDTQAQLSDELRQDVRMLAEFIGPRHFEKYDKLVAAAEYLEQELRKVGYEPARQRYEVLGREVWNIEVEARGTSRHEEILIIGAHYDSVQLWGSTSDCPGANDNGSGVAATLALARRFAGRSMDRTVRFVLFVNEEPPYFQTEDMGSVVYANRCRERDEKIVGMLSLETIGYYSDKEGSQSYPPPIGSFYPSTGNFISFVGNVGSRGFTRDVVRLFREHGKFPSEGGALPGFITGVGWSDQWSFWKHGYPAVMVTDTAVFRYPWYHSPGDTWDKLDYDRAARVVDGIAMVVEGLATVSHR